MKKAKTNDEGYNLYLRMMMITDFISGMTDSYARIYIRTMHIKIKGNIKSVL